MLCCVRALIVTSLVALSSAACSGVPVNPEPLPAERQQSLRCHMLGTWELVETDGDPVTYAQIRYTFRDDGSGLYDQTSKSSMPIPGGQNPYQWELEGRNIYLLGTAGPDSERVFRADDWSAEQMTWLNYTLGDTFTLTRVGEPPACP